MKQHHSLFWWLSWKVIKTVIIKCTSATTTAVITSMNRLQLLQVLLLLEIKAWVVIREAITVAAAATVAVQFNWTFIYTWNRKTLIQGRREKKKNMDGIKKNGNISWQLWETQWLIINTKSSHALIEWYETTQQQFWDFKLLKLRNSISDRSAVTVKTCQQNMVNKLQISDQRLNKNCVDI